MKALFFAVLALSLFVALMIDANASYRADEAWMCGRYADSASCSAGAPSTYMFGR